MLCNFPLVTASHGYLLACRNTHPPLSVGPVRLNNLGLLPYCVSIRYWRSTGISSIPAVAALVGCHAPHYRMGDFAPRTTAPCWSGCSGWLLIADGSIRYFTPNSSGSPS